MTEFQEELTKAHHGAQGTVANLRAAHMMAGAVEGLLILPMIERAMMLAGDIERLLHAVRHDDAIDAAILANAKETTS